MIEGMTDDLISHVRLVAREAGHAILEIYGNPRVLECLKPDNSPLTLADRVSNQIIHDRLTRLAPEWPVLSEESAEVPFDERKCWRRFWMVDPLDGTKEFLCGNGEFTVNIALIEDGAPAMGVVYVPVHDRVYFAERGIGAYREQGGAISKIRVKPPSRSIVRVLISRSHAQPNDDFGRFAHPAATREYIPMGSSLKFCAIAEGSADLYPRLGPTMEWDTAAAQCILEEAGGVVTDLDGNAMRYNKPTLANPFFVAKGSF
jgi:3'(2'), 5'-bisphosphate nucleotidase